MKFKQPVLPKLLILTRYHTRLRQRYAILRKIMCLRSEFEGECQAVCRILPHTVPSNELASNTGSSYSDWGSFSRTGVASARCLARTVIVLLASTLRPVGWG
jgi:hypothetical protein